MCNILRRCCTEIAVSSFQRLRNSFQSKKCICVYIHICGMCVLRVGRVRVIYTYVCVCTCVCVHLCVFLHNWPICLFKYVCAYTRTRYFSVCILTILVCYTRMYEMRIYAHNIHGYYVYTHTYIDIKSK